MVAATAASSSLGSSSLRRRIGSGQTGPSPLRSSPASRFTMAPYAYRSGPRLEAPSAERLRPGEVGDAGGRGRDQAGSAGGAAEGSHGDDVTP